MNKTEILNKITKGFEKLNVADKYKSLALENIEKWLTDEEFKEYVPQIEYLVEIENWDLLLDAFYQVVPFGTGGRRGPVGIGPNRINVWTLQASAQGHSQYLQKLSEDAGERGIVISYDVRKYTKEGEYDNGRPNPVKDLDCKTLAEKIAEVYMANGIKVFLFPDFASTPELSFMVRHLKAIAGDMISASHNPPEFNGKKVVNETGGQLIAPYDQQLVDVVVNEVSEIKRISIDEGKQRGLFEYISDADREAFLEAAQSSSLNPKNREAKILFSPFHGTSYTSVLKVMKTLGFDITMDEATGKVDPKFSHITYNLPNPEVVESFDSLIPEAEKINADVILVTDPDGDRIGIMSKESNGWRFYTGNEIMSLCTAYILEEKKNDLKDTNVIVKTLVTTNFLSVLAREFGVQIIGDLLVGIKYIGAEMNKLEAEGRIDDFIIGVEESHGATMGNYVRDKDSSVPAILLGELASRLKREGKTVGNYLDQLYKDYGYFRNFLTEIRLPGAEGMSRMQDLMRDFREKDIKNFREFEVEEFVDRWSGGDFLSETDKSSRDLIVYKFKNKPNTETLSVAIRPSGTEPKTKFYFEIGMIPSGDLEKDKNDSEEIRKELEKAVLQYAYKVIGMDFPDRVFLLFTQMAALVKMKYFEVEPEIVKLKEVGDVEERKKQLMDLLSFLGSDPIKKVDLAFKEEYGVGIEEYLGIN